MVGTALTLSAAHHPHHVAVVFDHVRLTHRELNARACRLANAFAGLGLAKGDRVGALLHNAHQFIEAFFAAAKIGAIFVPVNFRLATPEVGRILDDCAASVLLCGSEFAPTVSPLAATTSFPRCLVEVPGPAAGGPGLEGAIKYEALIDSHPAAEPDRDVTTTDDQLILYTSGTTGHPKGAVWTHGNTLASATAKIIDFALTPRDATVVFGPLFHVGPLMDLVIPLLARGGTVVLGRSRGFDPSQLLAVIDRERATVVSVYPAMWRRVLALGDLERYDLGSLRLLLTGGEPVGQALLSALYARFRAVPFVNTYGSTEGGPIATFLAPEHRVEKMGSIGKGAFNVDVRIVDDRGFELAPGAVGEIAVRSPVVCRGYWRRPQETAAALRAGWWHMGDLGWKDEDGFLWIAGRKTDMIISGAENIYPVEVENVISTLEGVAEVAVVGVPDPDWGETVTAFVVRKAGATVDEARIIDYCRASLASYKKPRHIFFVDALPRTVEAGKVSKEALRLLARTKLAD